MARGRRQATRVVGVDTGGTFTDLVLLGTDGREERRAKLSSTPEDPARAVRDGLLQLGDRAEGSSLGRGDEIVHGTTVALNALLTGRVARAALVTNAGFADLIDIGRQDRPALYALHPLKRAPLVPRELRFELAQRSAPDEQGRLVELERPSRAELARLARALRRSGAESVAVCLLHSYAAPEIEERVARALAPLGLSVSRSAGLSREPRELERFSTAIANAALVPVVAAYLERIERAVGEARLVVLQSSGGTLSVERAREEPVRVLLSGPAGGVIGAARAAREAGLAGFVALDMGGTSTDVAHHQGNEAREERGLARASTRRLVAGIPIALPALDVHTIGCGGGSLARVDAGGVLHVGPQSAGADPGPVAYGRGETPTVTDAHVLLGHLASGEFLGGRLELDREGVRRAFERLGKRLGAPAEEAARAVLAVARAAMRRALAVATLERGEDPRGLPLVAYGGAGGLHAAALAQSLGMPGALVPARPGLLSAWGMAGADAMEDRALAVLEPLARWPASRRARAVAELVLAGERELLEAGHERRALEHELVVDLRYAGQSSELALPEPARARAGAPDPLVERFHARHEKLHGWRLDEREIELVGLRVRSIARRLAAPRSERAPRAREAPAAAFGARRAARIGTARGARVARRELLPPGSVLRGPALIEEFSGTTVVPPGWEARVVAGGHLWLAEA